MSTFKTAFVAAAAVVALSSAFATAQASDGVLHGRVPVGMQMIEGEATPVYGSETYVVTQAKPMGWTKGSDAQPVYDTSVTSPVGHPDVVASTVVNDELIVVYKGDAVPQVAKR